MLQVTEPVTLPLKQRIRIRRCKRDNSYKDRECDPHNPCDC